MATSAASGRCQRKLRAWTRPARPPPMTAMPTGLRRAKIRSSFPKGSDGASVAEPTPAPLVKDDDPDDDGAHDDPLPEGRDVHQVQAVVEHAHDEHSDDGAAHAALAAEQVGAADDHRGEGVQLCA